MDDSEIVQNESNENLNRTHLYISQSQLHDLPELHNEFELNSFFIDNSTENYHLEEDNSSERLLATHIIDNLLQETLDELHNYSINENNNNDNINNSNEEEKEESEDEENNNDDSYSSRIETSTVNSADIDILSNDFNNNNNPLNNLRNANENQNINNCCNKNNTNNNTNNNKEVDKINNNFNNSNNKTGNLNNNNIISRDNKLLFNDSISSKTSLNKSMTVQPFNKLEEYKKSSKYKYLEDACYFANKLENLKTDGKYDFASDEGNDICKDFLEQIENLFYCHHIKITSRDYRKKFSKAYIYLYEENSLGYLTEILDSAQEATPYLIVNDEKYVFSQDVIVKGNQLFLNFCSLIVVITESLNKLYDEIILDYTDINKIENNIKKSLGEFDKFWAKYEEKYITELMCIEKISRRFIFEGINIDKEMSLYEKKALIKGKNLISMNINSTIDKEYNKIRNKLVKTINTLNKVANINGKGRNDLEINILYQAEKVLCTVSEIQSSGLRKLAKDVIKTLQDFRSLFRNYSKNIDCVDPQLINNPELVNNLYNWEQTWEKGKKYLCNNVYYKKLLRFNKIIDVIVEKYKEQHFRNFLEQSDPEIFITIPSILILEAVDSHNNEIIEEFIPDLKNNEIFKNIKKQIKFVYKKFKDKNYSYNLFEELILFQNVGNNHIYYQKSFEKLKQILSEKEIKTFIRDMRMLSMNLQRFKPKDWNEFFQLAMNIEKE